MYNAFYNVFPYRSAGIGFGSAAARVGGVLCPFILLLGDYYKMLPYFIFGGSALVAGILILLLPETRNTKLPETVLEAEAIYGW